MTYTFAHEFSNNSDGSNTSDITCSRIQDFIQELGLSCENATEYNRRYINVGKREGMNILGIILFTIAFGIVLGRQGPDGRNIVKTFGVLNEVIMKLVSLVMW